MKLVQNQESIVAEFIANRGQLLAFIRALTSSSAITDDIQQEVWVRLVKALETGVEIHDTSKWCRGVARNLLLHHWRDAKKFQVMADPELLSLISLGFDENEGREEEWLRRELALKHCLAKMPDHARQILTLRYEEGLSMGLVAQRTRTSITAATKLLSRLRERLRACTEKAMSTEGFDR